MTRSPRRRIRADDEAAIERMVQAMDPGGMELEWKRDLAHRAFAALLAGPVPRSLIRHVLQQERARLERRREGYDGGAIYFLDERLDELERAAREGWKEEA